MRAFTLAHVVHTPGSISYNHPPQHFSQACKAHANASKADALPRGQGVEKQRMLWGEGTGATRTIMRLTARSRLLPAPLAVACRHLRSRLFLACAGTPT
eukprot:6213921-Pleurochrysis_carterae.AAC.2